MVVTVFLDLEAGEHFASLEGAIVLQDRAEVGRHLRARTNAAS
jgi:hypothetical protein